MQRARLIWFKLAAALQTSDAFIGAETAGSEFTARMAAAKSGPITT
jgi:hypothetical protein